MKKILFCAVALMIAISSCKQSKPVKTTDNLKAGIKGETTASAKYAAFAKKAREEGNANIAKLFDAASKSESVHAANHRKVLDQIKGTIENFNPEFEVKSTAENLQAAIQGETYEVQTMYPGFINDAKQEKGKNAVKSFTWANDTEKKHAQFYTTALKALQNSEERTLPSQYAVCPVCGNTYDAGSVDAKCSFCQTGKEKFVII
ncbi:MAG TPA: ferritin family protein [Bacteroidales bacterium]|nr:ferritin family protein [Bacteroidales bacterium]